MAKQDWTVYAAETTTGRIAAEIPFVNVNQWLYGLNNIGGGSVTVPLGGNGMSAADIEELSQPWRWSWAVCFGDNYVCQAGPVIGELMEDTQNYTTVTFAGIWKLFAKRLLFPAGFTGGNPATIAADTSYTNLTYRQIAANIISTSLARGPAPIVLPPADPADAHAMHYFGYDMNIVADMLTNLTALVDGPEIEFRPQFDPTQPGYLQWVMRVGAPRLGQLGSSWVWDYGARGAVQSLAHSRDGSQMTFSDYTRCSGSQYGLLVGNGQNLGLAAGYPLLEDVNGDHTNVTVAATAASYAQQWVNTYQYAVNTPAAIVRVDAHDLSGRLTGSPTLDQVAVGDTATFAVEDHRRIPDGIYTHRITAVGQGGNYDTAALTLQPVVGVN